MKIICNDCKKEIKGSTYIDKGIARCEKCVDKFYKLEKQNEVTSPRDMAKQRYLVR